MAHQLFEAAKAPFGLIFAFFTVITYYKYYLFGELFFHLTNKQIDTLYEISRINKLTGLFALFWLLINVGSVITKGFDRYDIKRVH
ncbi:hypothetical protein ABET15_04260 [Heyndrickxia faecalis]|uniref:hypothetical protein n=1 Tax=Heyndrickxia TaxID=2837504 RepID=UPI002E218569|nr:hypothetical protein [Weizmannia sp. CD-2023]